MGRVVSYRTVDGERVATEKMANLAYPVAITVEDHREAIMDALNVLGPLEGHNSGCDGCDYERFHVIRMLLDVLDCKEWIDYLRLRNKLWNGTQGIRVGEFIYQDWNEWRYRTRRRNVL